VFPTHKPDAASRIAGTVAYHRYTDADVNIDVNVMMQRWCAIARVDCPRNVPWSCGHGILCMQRGLAPFSIEPAVQTARLGEASYGLS